MTTSAAPAPSSPALHPPSAEPPSPRAARRHGPHRVFQVMGTVVSVDVRDPSIAESVVDEVEAHLRDR